MYAMFSDWTRISSEVEVIVLNTEVENGLETEGIG
jgi:hypothetical protein